MCVSMSISLSMSISMSISLYLSMSISMSKSRAMSILFYNIDRTLRALSLVKNLCFTRVENIEEACFTVFATLPLYQKENEEA